MSEDISPERALWQVNHAIDELQAELSQLEAERTAVAKHAAWTTRRYRYLCFLRWLRSPKVNFELWPMGVLLAGSFTFGTLGFVVVHLVTSSLPPAIFGFIWGTVIGIGLFATFLHYPADTVLPPAIAEAETESQLQRSRLAEVTPRVSLMKQRLQSLLQERRQWIASGKLLRASLLQLNWKEMRGYVWEDYLVQVCRTLGAKVERTGKCGDQGADLIVEFGTRRIAVQAKGFNDEYGVNNKAVQEAYTGKACHKCDACAVITNTRFMNSAKRSAIATGCILIGEDEFPDFVMGKIEL